MSPSRGLAADLDRLEWHGSGQVHHVHATMGTYGGLGRELRREVVLLVKGEGKKMHKVPEMSMETANLKIMLAIIGMKIG